MMFTEASKRYLNIWAFKLLEVIASREWNYPSFSLSTLQISTVKFYNSIRSSVTNKNDINFKNMFEFLPFKSCKEYIKNQVRMDYTTYYSSQ